VNIHIAPIGDLVEPVRTWNPATEPDATFTYVDLSAVDQNEKKIRSAVPVRGSEAPSRARQLINKGDILVSTVRPNLNGVAPVTAAFDGATASTGFCVLRPRSERLSSNYLMHWVRSPQFVDRMVREATGASYPAVSDRIVKASDIPLPPLEEQRRIATILDRADGLRRKCRHALDLLDSLPQSIFFAMFNSNSATTSQLETRTLGDICELIRDGVHKTPNYIDRGVPFVTVKNITSGTLDLTKTKFVSLEEHLSMTKRVRPEPGDILVSKDGTIGVPCVVPEGPIFSIFVSVALLKLKREIVDPVFLSEQIKTEVVQKQIRESSKGIAIRHLHLNDFAKLKIVLPPLADQKRFGLIASSVRRKREAIVACLKNMDSLFSSLQSRAFSGQL
jgi:type I restriction enzyme, S subunit